MVATLYSKKPVKMVSPLNTVSLLFAFGFMIRMATNFIYC